MKKLMLTAVLLTYCSTYFAQEEGKVVYVRMDKPKDNKPARMVDLDNVFKFDPLRMLSGEINFAYERRVGDKSSFEVELGPTVSQLGGFQFGTNHSYGGYASSRMGMFGSIGFRYYPLDDRVAFNGFYVSPKYTYKNYNVNYSIPNDATAPTVDGYDNMSNFTFNVGIQTWVAKNFSIDYYAGVGIGNYKSMYVNYLTVYDPNTQTYVTQANKETSNDFRYVVTLGLKIGIGH